MLPTVGWGLLNRPPFCLDYSGYLGKDSASVIFLEFALGNIYILRQQKDWVSRWVGLDSGQFC